MDGLRPSRFGGQDTDVCKDVLHEISQDEPLMKMRSAEKPVNESPSFDEKSNGCEAITNAFRIHTSSKFSVEITHEADRDTITRHIQNGIFNFGIDLFYGSVQQNVDVVARLREAVFRESQESGFSTPLSIYLRISPRHQFTGGLGGNTEGFVLKANTQVVLTTDRKYAARCCRRIIYVNARFLLPDVQKCDVIRVGEVIVLQVAEVRAAKLTCTVIAAGKVTKRMPVRFPRKFEWAHQRISAEELEDITFAMGTGVNVIVTNRPGVPEICAQVRNAMAELELRSYYLFTRLTLADLGGGEYSDVQWMVDDFDGFLLDCTDNVPHDRIVKLPLVAHSLVKEAYERRKPLFLAGCWSQFVHSTDYEVAFFYPDKYILPCKPEFLRLYEAVSHEVALAKCVDKNFADKSSTGSSTIARSIAAASFEFDADAIVMCAVSGQMAERIAHHRPETPIIAVTSVSGAANYACMHHNIWMLLFDANKSPHTSHKKDVQRKLVYGLEYAVKKRLISHASRIIFVYSMLSGSCFTDKFVVIRFSDDFVEVIKNFVLAD